MKRAAQWSSIRLVSLLGILLLLASCGGGGGGGGSVASGSSNSLSGSVQTPGGQVALNRTQRMLAAVQRWLIPAAIADVTGLANVPDATRVELIQVDSLGNPVSVLATTSTSGGRYSFDLGKLGVNHSSTLMVRLEQGTGVQMRAFATSSSVNIEPNSEAVVELVLEQIASTPGSSLTSFSNKEIEDAAAAVDMLTARDGLGASATVSATVAAIKLSATGHASLATFLSHAAGAGEADAPGDVVNYFPLAVGNSWSYLATPGGAFTVKEEVTGRKTVNGVEAFVISTTDPRTFTSSPPEEYLAKSSAGVVFHGDNDAQNLTLNQQTAPYLLFKLPAKTGETVTTLDKSQVELGQDLDGDGVGERFSSVKVTQTALGYETVTVPAGTFKCVKLRQDARLTLVGSASKVTVDSDAAFTVWLAPNIGPVKQHQLVKVTTSNGAPPPISEDTLELKEASIDGFLVPQDFRLRTIALPHNDMVYDGARDRIYASSPSAAGAHGNSIAVIDPQSATIEKFIPIGSEPTKLALSDDQQYLYVGLNGSGQVRRLKLADTSIDLTFSLDNDAFQGQRYATDIRVLSGSPQSVIVAWGYQFAASPSGYSVYDNAVKRTKEINVSATPPLSVGRLASGSASNPPYAQIGSYLLPGQGTFAVFGIAALGLDASGLTVPATSPLDTGGFGIGFTVLNGRIYTGDGKVWDIAQRQQLGIFSNTQGCIPDGVRARSYCMQSGAFGTIAAYDHANFTPLATATIPQGTAQSVAGLLRWGDRGLAASATRGFFPAEQVILLITSSALMP